MLWKKMPTTGSHEATQGSKSPSMGWSRLRFLLPRLISSPTKEPPPSTVTPGGVAITDELTVGGLSVLILRLWFDRDERGRRRVPIFLHRLRIRISDSLHPLHGSHSVFRIECEYANGAIRWVIYRQLRDFLSLHAHFSVSKAYNRNIEKLPEFPRTSIPYFKFLKKESRERGSDVSRADFARLQREALENYLIDLIRAVMFLPTSNRLAGFLEISALSLHLAQSGGAQYKAGYLRIVASGNKGAGFGRKSASRSQKRKPKWCVIRDSYLIAVEEPGELVVWDIFLLDANFKIKRPTRYYRQGLNLLHGDSIRDSLTAKLDPTDSAARGSVDSANAEHKSLLGSIRSRVSHMLHPHRDASHAGPSSTQDGEQEQHVRSDTDADSLDPDSSPPTPLLDPSTNADPLNEDETDAPRNQDEAAQRKKTRPASREVSKHTFYVENSQMRLKLFARSERQMLQWIAGLEKAAATSPFVGSNRFDSFAPIRMNVSAQWLVDGRDYFWNLSRAILLAKDTIYIQDWWLSPELNLRRPGMPKYRLDNLLEKKAKEGVKIFIILYQEVSNRTTPTDSNYTKQRLTLLHPNIMVQRSPSHFQTGTLYWAHHEKLCVIDSTIAFMGGLDLCFGRWDTPQHALVDDPEEGEEPIWPGKDYSNARSTDFHTLTKPEEDMHDRTRTPRMPWHDVGLQIVGQPARDLGRHFVQRWNYLLRIKNHSRVMPFLIPPSEFKPGELTQLELTGTCELQICRSAGPWSLGTTDRVEHSIQNAYLKAIQLSEHFVYIENQFFITSTVVEDVTIENKIGDAIVHRIIRAHHEGKKWKCCLVIPLLPGFPFPVDHADASAVRIILECQNRSISRGPNSIFSRLLREGIDPDEYFTVFSLRNWAKLRGDILTTELVYIHGKVCIVDDRLAIIGSANINERSQRGDRDSELAAVIRDTDMIDGKMDGKPFKVGRFAHSLRVRLMREHIGIDVDALDDEDTRAHNTADGEHVADIWDPDGEQQHASGSVTEKRHHAERVKDMMRDAVDQVVSGFKDVRTENAVRGLSKTGLKRALPNPALQEGSISTHDGGKRRYSSHALSPTLEEKFEAEHHPPTGCAEGIINDESVEGEGDGSAPVATKFENGHLPMDASLASKTYSQPSQARIGKNDNDGDEQKAQRARNLLRKYPNVKLGQSARTVPTQKPKFDADSFEDPLCDEFWEDIWVASAVHNTEIFRRVFRVVPDDLVTTWKHYKDYVTYHERMLKPLEDDLSSEPLGRVPSTGRVERTLDEQGTQQEPRGEDASTNSHSVKTHEGTLAHLTNGHARCGTSKHEKSITEKPTAPPAGEKTGSAMPTEKTNGSVFPDKGKKNRGEPPFTKQEREEMEALLEDDLCGHLVIHPTRFLESEDVANNFLFNTDRMLPLPIYD
ncbi:phospholipase D [Russula emetica]|nr:phospholipase D [Russula emetica]